MLTVIPRGDLRRILSLRVRIARKRIMFREKERESTMDAMEATILGLKTKSGLRPYSRYKSSLYTTEAAALKAINRRRKQWYIPGYKLLGQRGRVIRQKEINATVIKVLGGGCKGEGRTKGFG